MRIERNGDLLMKALKQHWESGAKVMAKIEPPESRTVFLQARYALSRATQYPGRRD